jgi:nickel transport protein
MKHTYAYALALLLLAGPAAAHSVWIEPNKAGKLMIENGDAGEPSDPYDPARITKAYAFDKDGKPVAAEVDRFEKAAAVKPAASAALVAAMFDNKYWAKGSDNKWSNGPKGTVANPTIAGPSFKMPKTYLAPTSAFAKPVGFDLEIVPQSDPATLKAGDKLTLLVLLKGQPLADASLVSDIFLGHDVKADKVKTDKDGKATVTVPKRAFAGVEVSHFAKDAGSSVEGTFYNASMTFKVKP